MAAALVSFMLNKWSLWNLKYFTDFLANYLYHLREIASNGLEIPRGIYCGLCITCKIQSG